MHPLRNELHNELHARPSIYFDEPAHVFHLTLLGDSPGYEPIIQQLSPGTATQAQGMAQLDGLALKWERHTEFLSLTLVMPKQAEGELWPQMPVALRNLVAGREHLILECSHILVESSATWSGYISHYGFKDPAGSEIGAGDAVVWSDFRLSSDGTTRLLLVNQGLNAYRLGRMVRRLLEIETYRMMASLAVPVAKEVSSFLTTHERELVRLSEANAAMDEGDAKQILAQISTLSADVVSCTARTRQRFSATDAYAQLVFERIGELREGHVAGCQRLGVFIERRFKPTVRYCSATCERLQRLYGNVANLGELLQARVQVEVEEQNNAILQSLSTRATTQIKIQKAVEGLSIIAISYYLLSLLKLLYQGAHSLGLQATPKEALTYLTPVAILLLAAIASHIRKTRQA
ncbi:MAG: DUF3422 domain-containing protein [Pseudomonas sp.]